MDIEIIGISAEDTWPQSKRTNYHQLKVITARIIEKAVDITQGKDEAQKSIVLVYAHYGTEEARFMLNKVLQLRGEHYNESMVDVLWQRYTINNKLSGNRKLVNICKDFNIDTTINDDGKITDEDELAGFLPADVDAKFVLEHGFYGTINSSKTGYYFRTGDKTFAAQSNFILEPLMHVLSKTDNKRIIAIDNGRKRSILDLPSRALISVEQFSGFCFEEGNYTFWGGKIHLMKIVNSLNEKFPVCYELKTLGWQPEGFFAFSNAVYEPCHAEALEASKGEAPVQFFNDLGIASVNETNYFSPSASDIYKNQRAEDDEYENDRYLRYIESKVTFAEWCSMFHKVYPQQSMYGIGFVFIGLFKDCIYKIDNNCPHLSAYGEKGSGKSKFAESVAAVFLNDLQPFNLNHGTDFAFFNRLSRFRNCVTWFDEFDDQAIKEDRFQSIKGAYDGAGRERGKGGSKSKTEIARINSALLITGQYLSTRDDNAALTRCIILPFSPDNDRSVDAIHNYEQLKTTEKKGISSIIIELLQHREAFAKEYPKTFPETFSDVRELIRSMGGEYEERVLRNYTAILNCYKFFCQHISFPFTYESIKQQCAKDVIKLSTLISQSDSLADFWNTVVYLMEIGEIYEGFHYRIMFHSSISIRKDGGKDYQHNFTKPTKLLALRLTTIHKMYLEAHKRQTGKTGINMQSLELYMNSAKGFVGKNSSLSFTDRETGKGTSTSSYVFEYDLLGVPLEQSAPEQQEQHSTTIEGTLAGNIDHLIIAGKPQLKYTIQVVSTQMVDDRPFTSFEKTVCHDSILSNEPLILSNQLLQVTGQLKLSNWTNKEGELQTKRTLVVESVQLKEQQLSIVNPAKDEDGLPFP